MNMDWCQILYHGLVLHSVTWTGATFHEHGLVLQSVTWTGATFHEHGLVLHSMNLD